MTAHERAVFTNWLKDASGSDLFLLIRFALRYRKRSSAEKMRAVSSTPPKEDDNAEGDDV